MRYSIAVREEWNVMLPCSLKEYMDGMTIYTEAEIKALLEQAGFFQINVYRNEKKGWISFSATKQ